MIIFLRTKSIIIVFVLAVILFVVLTSVHFISYKNHGNNLKNAVKTSHEYLIQIYIEEKKLYLLEDGKCIKQYIIASGAPEWPSPIGKWKIINKGDWGEGFGGRWLGLNVIWGNYGIHGTTEESSIGGDYSHGCIRMFNSDVIELYDIVPIGTTVVIKNGPYGPFGMGFRDLLPGDRGADVLAVQERLKILGYFSGYESGIYEDDLKNAVHRFQKDNKLEIKNAITYEDYHSMGFSEFE